MQKLLSIFSLVFLFAVLSYGQATVDIPITVSDNAGGTLALRFGLDLTATAGIDPLLGESDLPPLPPVGVYDARFILGGGLSTLWDYRNATGFPFTGNVQHTMQWQFTTGGTVITVAYNLPAEATIQIVDVAGGGFWNSGTLSGTGTYNFTPPGFLTQSFINVVYTNIGTVPGPQFAVTPASLNLGNVLVPGGTSTLPITVQNSGDATLNLAGIASSDAQFTFAPNTFPVAIPAGGNFIFNVTFTPTSLGLKTGTLTFTHDAPGSPSVYNVQGTGVSPDPIFGVSPASVNFGNVGVGTTSDAFVTVSNLGVGDPLLVTSALTTAPEFTVLPASANIPAGGSQVFTVTFAPLAGGAYTGSLDFVHNAVGSPSSVALSGAATATYGLIFAQDSVYNLEDSAYVETMQLLQTPGWTSGKLQAIQFRLHVNKTAGDNNILRFHSLGLGTSVPTADGWVLEYNIFRGPLTSNGATLDSIYVLLYNLNQDGGLLPGNYTDLLKVSYSTVDLPALMDTSMSTFRTTDVIGSTFEGFPVDVAPSRDDIKIFVLNRVPSLGDVNGDGSIDILDLIMVVDHIVGRDSLENIDGTIDDEFGRADIAPWVVGNIAPAPDLLVNVFDLSVIQNIILTGFYPNGVAINKPVILAGNDGLLKVTNTEAKVIFHITDRGIAARIVSDEAIRGAQIEFSSVKDDASAMTVDSRLAGGYYLQVEDLLRVLLYDMSGQAVIPAGEHFLANMPFAIKNPRSIELDKVILVNTKNEKIGTVIIEISYANAPEIPVDYALFQNYPNPFNPTTLVRFAVPYTDFVTLKVYDMLGQEVSTLFSGQVQMGTYTVQWNGLDNAGIQMASGNYIYRMTASGFVQSKKMVLLK